LRLIATEFLLCITEDQQRYHANERHKHTQPNISSYKEEEEKEEEEEEEKEKYEH
jgi:hypothetical protein